MSDELLRRGVGVVAGAGAARGEAARGEAPRKGEEERTLRVVRAPRVTDAERALDEEEARKAVRLRPLNEAQQALALNAMRETRRVAERLGKRWSTLVSVEELVSAGHVAQVEVARDYIPSKGPFWAYASGRVLGAMLTLIRKEATFRHYFMPYSAACEFLLGVSDPADRMRDSDEEIRGNMQAFSDAFSASMFIASMYELLRSQEEWAVAEREVFARGLAALREEIEGLPEHEQRLIRMHYEQEVTLEVMAPEFAWSYATMRRRHKEVLVKLGEGLRARGIEHASGDGPDEEMAEMYGGDGGGADGDGGGADGDGGGGGDGEGGGAGGTSGKSGKGGLLLRWRRRHGR